MRVEGPRRKGEDPRPRAEGPRARVVGSRAEGPRRWATETYQSVQKIWQNIYALFNDVEKTRLVPPCRPLLRTSFR
jgi:hypothetical protein